jgi:hypothetical protein
MRSDYVAVICAIRDSGGFFLGLAAFSLTNRTSILCMYLPVFQGLQRKLNSPPSSGDDYSR